MQLNKYLVIFYIFISYSHAYEELPVLSSKQSATNLRFFTQDGKNTYYQRRSGALLMSTNYKVNEVIKGDLGSHFNLSATRFRKQIIGTMNSSYHNSYAMRSSKKVFIIPYAGYKVKFIGEGVNPRLHLEDKWASFYVHKNKSISIISLISKALNYSIKTNNNVNPYFVPQTLMVTTKKIIFTDLNSKGTPGLILLDKLTNKLKPLLKLKDSTHKIEICSLSDSQIAIGIFPLVKSSVTRSEISIINAIDLDLSKKRTIYSSTTEDIGNMICSLDGEYIYFIQDQSVTDRIISNSVKLNTKTKIITTLSHVNDATNMSYIDGMLLLPNKGKLLILDGKKNLKDVDIIGN